MVQKRKPYFAVPDLMILMWVATAIYGVVAIGNHGRAEFHPVTEINLSVWSLPYYTLLSGIRGFVAYSISLAFTLIVGYLAAYSKRAERVIIPLLDILQSIPVLGFLPGLVIGFVALFPHTNTGLELAAILMIFTGQVWNMTFSYYASLKSIPSEFIEASTVIGLSRFQRLMRIELPYSAVNLAWNSLLSMAGGWFFLIPCEAMTLGEKEYRLPGIGSYMDVAVKKGDLFASGMAVLAMVALIVMSDFLIWRPILAWVRKFRIEDIPGIAPPEPLMQIWIRESRLIRWVSVQLRRVLAQRRLLRPRSQKVGKGAFSPDLTESDTPLVSSGISQWKGKLQRSLKYQFKRQAPFLFRVLGVAVYCFCAYGVLMGVYRLLCILVLVKPLMWIILFRDTLWTLLRVLMAVTLSTLWAVPVGIWLATSPLRARIAQPIIQILASFPAPMLYPIALTLFFVLGVSFDWAAMLLMMLGIQWYILFNVMAGALRIPQELKSALELMNSSRWDLWRTLYLPSIFPNLVTGWITASGGAWNASVVAEYLHYKGQVLKTGGLGADLSIATVDENFTLLAASLTVMVFIVVILNRTFWSQLSRLAQTRYRMELM